ncbi:hypothetical protein ATG98_0564 [Marinobacter sp. LV10R520-4]|nr:hypothetical protein ATG98_0564 [Marinobacter sp. LV10R520-4]
MGFCWFIIQQTELLNQCVFARNRLCNCRIGSANSGNGPSTAPCRNIFRGPMENLERPIIKTILTLR